MMNFKLGKNAKDEQNLEYESEPNSSEQGSDKLQDEARQVKANSTGKSPSPEQEMSEATGAVSEQQELQEKADAEEPLQNTAENLSFSPEKMSFTPDLPEEANSEQSSEIKTDNLANSAADKTEDKAAEPSVESAQKEVLLGSQPEAESSAEEKAEDNKAARNAAAARNRSLLLKLALGGIFAALYVLLALALAPISYGILQFRLSEVLVALPLLSSAAVPGVFLGCLIANILNPQNLGLVDIFGGSLATLAAACISYALGRGYRETLSRRREIRLLPEIEQQKIRRSQWWRRFFLLLPPVLLNMFTVGIYLPYLLLEAPSQLEIVGSVTLIGLSEAAVVYGLGLPLLLALERSGLPWQKL